MKFPVLAVAVIAAAALTFTPARAKADGHVNFFLGEKSLSGADWEPLEDQFAFGAVMSFGRDDWPVHIAVDVLTSFDQTTMYDPFLGDVTFTGTTFEVDMGVRKIWKKGRVLPYLGAGIGIMGAGVEADGDFDTESAADAGFGFWADTGVFFRLGSHFNLGLDLRYSSADVDLDFGDGFVASDVNAGGFSYGLLLGFGW